MTMIAKCLDAKVEAGELTRKQAEDFLRDLESTIDRNTTAGGGDMDHARAVRLAQAKRAAAEKHRQQAALQILAVNRAAENAGTHAKGWAAGVQALLARDWWNKAGYSNVEARTKAVRGELHGMFEAGLDLLRPKGILQQSDELALERFVRELYGVGTGDKEASGAAQAWAKTTDHAVQRFNNAGGAITRKEDWRLPQVFDGRRVKAAGQERFRETLLNAYQDGSLKIRDFETGDSVTLLRAVEIIDQAWASISTDGLANLVPGRRGGRKVANRHNLPRAFEWASADAWLKFNDEFGAGRAGIFDLLTNHIEGMARDIGLVEVLGPNPDATMRQLTDMARKNGATAGQADRLGHLYDTVTGRAFSPVNEAWAEGLAGVRAWLSAAQLGSAMLSSVSDFATLRLTSAWNGLDASKVMARYVGALANEKDRKLAIRTGLIAESWVNRGLAANRDQGEVIGSGIAQRAAEHVMRLSGLQQHTAAGRWAFGMEFKAHLADMADTAWTKLPDETRRGFAAYGVTKTDWDLVRAAGITDYGDDLRMFDPAALAQSDKPGAFDAANRIQEMILSEMDYAIPTPGARERALLLQGTRPGTVTGELLRSFVQYKTFPITMMSMHLMRGFSAGGAAGRGYIAQLALSTTVMGALAIQMKEIAKGKDPRDPADWKFWGAAFVQGGGAGLFGDFLYSGLSRADKGLMSAVGGPTWGLLEDAYKLSLGNIGEATGERDTNFGRELARFVRSNTPGSSIWYGRLALDRVLWDRLQEAVDPEAARSFARMANRARQEMGQDYWWSPGEYSPTRLPSFTATEAP